ncbi:MAG: hypothetical protein HZA52_21725 [Planctomycetes bacterium]|nr:hypothetical protein [Planctomycetota bacterium]
MLSPFVALGLHALLPPAPPQVAAEPHALRADAEWLACVRSGAAREQGEPEVALWLHVAARHDQSVAFVAPAKRTVVSRAERRMGFDSTLALGDIDGDGAIELAHGDGAQRWSAHARATGRELWNLGEPERLGLVRAAIDDLDCDGVRELVGWSWRPLEDPDRGIELAVWSGATGELVERRPSPSDVVALGEVTSIADLDGDGAADLAVLGGTTRPNAAGTLDLVTLSSRTLEELARMRLCSDGRPNGAVRLHGPYAASRVDADLPAVVHVARVERDAAGDEHATWISVDVRRAEIRWATASTFVGRSMELGVDFGADLDGDGIGDLLTRATSERRGEGWGEGWGAGESGGVLAVLSGLDGRELRAHAQSVGSPGAFPVRTAFVGDLDGDRVEDYAGVRALDFFDFAETPEVAEFFSGRTGEALMRLP